MTASAPDVVIVLTETQVASPVGTLAPLLVVPVVAVYQPGVLAVPLFDVGPWSASLRPHVGVSLVVVPQLGAVSVGVGVGGQLVARRQR